MTVKIHYRVDAPGNSLPDTAEFGERWFIVGLLRVEIKMLRKVVKNVPYIVLKMTLYPKVAAGTITYFSVLASCVAVVQYPIGLVHYGWKTYESFVEPPFKQHFFYDHAEYSKMWWLKEQSVKQHISKTGYLAFDIFMQFHNIGDLRHVAQIRSLGEPDLYLNVNNVKIPYYSHVLQLFSVYFAKKVNELPKKKSLRIINVQLESKHEIPFFRNFLDVMLLRKEVINITNVLYIIKHAAHYSARIVLTICEEFLLQHGRKHFDNCTLFLLGWKCNLYRLKMQISYADNRYKLFKDPLYKSMCDEAMKEIEGFLKYSYRRPLPILPVFIFILYLIFFVKYPFLGLALTALLCFASFFGTWDYEFRYAIQHESELTQ